jgi:siroheme synthase (precorrin-2 oxidase/ferrochelatase)
MRFLPLFFDTSSGVFILVGSGEAALAKLRLLRAAGAHVRWFSCSIDVAEELSTSPGKGQLEISVGDPLKADLSDVVAIVSAAGDLFDHHIAARASAAHPGQCCRPPGSVDLYLSRHRRSWRGGRRHRHRRSFPGSGAAPA